MKAKTAALLGLLAIGSLPTAHAQGTADPGGLGYFVGYHTAVLELENGRAFCVSSESMSSLAAAVRGGGSAIDSKKPAKGIVSALATAFPCTDKSFDPPAFRSKEIARALLQLDLADDVLDDQKFVASHGIGMIVATTDLGEGRLFCMAGSTRKLSEVLEEHQSRTSVTTLSPAFIVDALKAGYPCER